MQDFRVIDLPERTTLDSSDYTMIDSAENGTNKYLLSRQAAETDAKITTAVGGVEAELDAAVEDIEESITALQGDVETVGTTLETKADKDGTYPDMAVGSVLGTNTVTDTEPYFLRPSASIGDREFDTLVGGTLGWNQLLQNGNFESDTGWGARNGSVSVADNVITVTATQAGTLCGLRGDSFTIQTDHVYLVGVGVYAPITGTVGVSFGGESALTVNHAITANAWTQCDVIIKSNKNEGKSLYALINQSINTGDIIKYRTAQVIDLTIDFGSTIADYIYSLEQTHAGDGVAWVRKYLPNAYYPYCAPTLKHVSGVSAHVLTGFNQWDEVWEVGYIDSNGANTASTVNIRSKNHIPILPNTTYYLRIGYTTIVYCPVFFYDADKNFISASIQQVWNRTIVTPSNVHFMRFYINAAYGATYNHDICINLSDASKNGQYEPYVKHEYPIDSTWIGMGVPRLVDGKLKFDGDIYPSSGECSDRYGIVDMGTLNWVRTGEQTDVGCYRANGFASAKFKGNLINTRFLPAEHPDYGISSWTDKTIGVGNSSALPFLFAKDTSYSDAATFKASLSGQYLVYEKATPTTSSASPFTSPQICDKDGTEEYVSTGLVPVGHETEYVENLADKLTDIPDLPTTAGTYSLKVTVSGGVPSYSWASA